MQIWVDVEQEDLRVKILTILRSGKLMNGYIMIDPTEQVKLTITGPIVRVTSKITTGKEQFESDNLSGIPILTITIFPKEHYAYLNTWHIAGVAAAMLECEIGNELISIIQHIADHISGTMIISHRLLIMLRDYQFDGPVGSVVDLTHREKQVLTCIALGATYKIAGLELGISPETVRGHVKHIYRKLDVKSQAEAVVKAMRYDIIRMTAFS